MNQLFNLFNGNSGVANFLQNTPFGNFANFINQYNQFRNSFNGNAQQEIQNLINSGKISQNDYNKAVQIRDMMKQMMNRR